MPRPKKSSLKSTEKERFEVLMEEVRGELKMLAEGQHQLREEMVTGFQRVREEMNQRFTLVEQAIRENSADIKKNSEDIKELQKDVRGLFDWSKTHETAHTT